VDPGWTFDLRPGGQGALGVDLGWTFGLGPGGRRASSHARRPPSERLDPRAVLARMCMALLSRSEAPGSDSH